MSDKIKGFTVTLKQDISEEHAEGIMNAILMLNGVADVKESITNGEDYMNRSMVSHEMRMKLYDFLSTWK